MAASFLSPPSYLFLLNVALDFWVFLSKLQGCKGRGFWLLVSMAIAV